MRTKYFSTLIVAAAMLISSCKKFVDVGTPKTEITSETVFTTDASAIAAIKGIYSLMMTNQSFMNGDIERLSGLISDELDGYSLGSEDLQFYQAGLTAINGQVNNFFWKEAYSYIHNANAMIKGLSQSTSLTAPTVGRLTGEAKFVRALCYFYLVNLFGDVPYITEVDYKVNADASRTHKDTVYKRIVDDLVSAWQVLPNNFSNYGNERIQPNKGAAAALLARVYLYTGQWQKAEEMATVVISNTSVYGLESDLNKVFLANSKETIWQLKPVIPGVNTSMGQYFILWGIPDYVGGVALSNSINGGFEAGDLRKSKWVGVYNAGSQNYYYCNKYKENYNNILKEYATVLRLAELYLIRAEARAYQNNIQGSQQDINIIRNRAGLGNTTASNSGTLLSAIFQERKVELFCEFGHRWLDLKRTGQAGVILGPIKIDWEATDVLFPIPQSEINVNPNLVQNPGF